MNYDPYENTACDVHSLINQHLSVNDIKESSLVSPQWYINHGESKQLMSQLLLKPSNKLSVAVIETVFLASRRLYTNLYFKCTYKSRCFVMRKLLVAYAPYLDHIKVGFIHADHEISQKINFPDLRNLEFCNENEQHKFFDFFATKKLNKLVLQSESLEVAEYLLNKNNIQSLIVRGNANLYMCNMSEILNNTIIRLDITYTPFTWSVVNQNVKKLLQSQSSSIISFNWIFDYDILRLVMAFQNIRHIGYYVNAFRTNPEIGIIPTNEVIESLDLEFTYNWSYLVPRFLQIILNRLPNLKKIRVTKINWTVLELIATICKNVEIIYYSTCNYNVRPALMYQEMKDMVPSTVKSNIKLIKIKSTYKLNLE